MTGAPFMTGFIVMSGWDHLSRFGNPHVLSASLRGSSARRAKCSLRLATRHLCQANSIPLMRKIAHERGTADSRTKCNKCIIQSGQELPEICHGKDGKQRTFPTFPTARLRLSVGSVHEICCTCNLNPPTHDVAGPIIFDVAAAISVLQTQTVSLPRQHYLLIPMLRFQCA